MSARFYAPAAQTPGELVALPDDEAQHLTRVLRIGGGETIRVFNGRGAEFDAHVERAARAGVEVRVGQPRTPAPEPRVSITLAQAVLKGDKMDDVVRDAVMVGAASIQPVITARTEVALDTLRRSHRRERWQRIAVSSAKQCGRAVVPDVREAFEFDALPAALSAMQLPAAAMMLVEPGAAVDVIGLRDLDARPPREVTLVVGPEGGWTVEEIRSGGDSCRLLTMGERTLRADAMGLVAVAALFAHWGEF